MENRLEVYLRTLNCPWCYRVGLKKDLESPVPDSITILDDTILIGTTCIKCGKHSMVQLASVTIYQFDIEGTAASACTFYGETPSALRKKALCGKRLEAYQAKKMGENILELHKEKEKETQPPEDLNI